MFYDFLYIGGQLPWWASDKLNVVYETILGQSRRFSWQTTSSDEEAADVPVHYTDALWDGQVTNQKLANWYVKGHVTIKKTKQDILTITYMYICTFQDLCPSWKFICNIVSGNPSCTILRALKIHSLISWWLRKKHLWAFISLSPFHLYKEMQRSTRLKTASKIFILLQMRLVFLCQSENCHECSYLF